MWPVLCCFGLAVKALIVCVNFGTAVFGTQIRIVDFNIKDAKWGFGYSPKVCLRCCILFVYNRLFGFGSGVMEIRGCVQRSGIFAE